MDSSFGLCCRLKIIDGLGVEVHQPGLEAGLQTVVVFDLLSEFTNAPEIRLPVGSLFNLCEDRQATCGEKGGIRQIKILSEMFFGFVLIDTGGKQRCSGLYNEPQFCFTATRVACSIPSRDSRDILLTNGFTIQPRPKGIRRDSDIERLSTNTPSSASSSLQ